MTILNESFNKADSDTLGPDLTWTELEGDIDIVSNKAQSTTVGGFVCARAESNLATIDHYAQATIEVSIDTHTNWRGIMVRRDSGATDTLNTGTFYLGRVDSFSNSVQLFRCVAGAVNQIDSASVTVNAGTPVLVRCEAVGSVIRILIDGVQAISYTDATPITTGVRTGMWGETDGFGSTITWENFEAGDIVIGKLFTLMDSYNLTP